MKLQHIPDCKDEIISISLVLLCVVIIFIKLSLKQDIPHAVFFDIPKTLADPGGAARRAPPKGPDSFVLTYKFFET